MDGTAKKQKQSSQSINGCCLSSTHRIKSNHRVDQKVRERSRAGVDIVDRASKKQSSRPIIIAYCLPSHQKVRERSRAGVLGDEEEEDRS